MKITNPNLEAIQKNLKELKSKILYARQLAESVSIVIVGVRILFMFPFKYSLL